MRLVKILSVPWKAEHFLPSLVTINISRQPLLTITHQQTLLLHATKQCHVEYSYFYNDRKHFTQTPNFILRFSINPTYYFVIIISCHICNDVGVDTVYFFIYFLFMKLWKVVVFSLTLIFYLLGQFYVGKICCMGSIKYYPYCSYCFIQEKLSHK